MEQQNGFASAAILPLIGRQRSSFASRKNTTASSDPLASAMISSITPSSYKDCRLFNGALLHSSQTNIPLLSAVL